MEDGPPRLSPPFPAQLSHCSRSQGVRWHLPLRGNELPISGSIPGAMPGILSAETRDPVDVPHHLPPADPRELPAQHGRGHQSALLAAQQQALPHRLRPRAGATEGLRGAGQVRLRCRQRLLGPPGWIQAWGSLQSTVSAGQPASPQSSPGAVEVLRPPPPFCPCLVLPAQDRAHGQGGYCTRQGR